MKMRAVLYLGVLLLSSMTARAQFFLDCSCLSTQAVLITNACQAVVPDLCQFTNCYRSTVVPPPQLICNQSPAPGTPVGPGVTTITVSVFVPGLPPQTCAVPFQVNALPGCGFGLLCGTNRTVECGSGWQFDPPVWTNACPNPNGTPPNVTVTVLNTMTNGSCPWTITRTWQAVDDCGQVATCSQTITVVDSLPPVLDCFCLTNAAALPPPPMVVTNCSGTIPDLCLYAQFCSYDQCGPLTCTQSPPAGTVVGVGVHPFTVTVTDCAGNSASCTYNYTVIAPPGGCNPTPPCHTFTNAWNSGAAGGSLLAPFTPDPVYQLISAPPGGCQGPAQVLDPSTLPAPPWVANGPNSQWIGAGPSSACQEGVYHFRLCFYLPCTDGAAIIGQWAVDDNGAIHLNGQPTGNSIPSAQFPNLPPYGFFPVNITNGFVCGTNCLDFYITNAFIGVNPTGMRAELTNIFNDCCCPAPRPIFTVASGMKGSGPLPSGAPDPQFSLTCAPPGVNVTTPVAVVPHPLWVPNGPNSQWIGPNQFNNAPAGVYCYTMQFVIPCPPGTPIQASLTGQWSADDTGTIHLNGQPTGNTLPNGWAFLNWSPLNITSGFVPGVNTLTFFVTNAGGPTGLRVELTGSASCCDCTNPPPPNCVCTFTNGTFDTFVPVNGTGGGWTASGVFSGDGWAPLGGNPGATFLLNNVGDPATDPMISQTLCCLTPGQCYTIHGQRKVQAWFGQTQPSFAVLVDGAPVLMLPVPTNPADQNWHNFSVSFVATNPCQTISFAAEYAGTDVSYWIDNIRLECCQTNSCVVCPPLHQTVFGCPPRMPDFTTNSFSGPGCTPAGPITVTQNVPPGTPLVPGSTTVVIIRVCDVNGQCRDCDVIVTAQSSGGVPYIRCPSDMVLLTCSNSATAYYAPTAFGNVGPVICTPPSGTIFPIGTHVVTCTVTNGCLGSATCSFNVRVRPQRNRWLCPWIAIGIPATPLGQAHLSSRPDPAFGDSDGLVVDNLGHSGQDGVRLDLGPAQKFTFSTVLDFNVPEGTVFDIALPPDPANPGGVPLLSFRSKGRNGYCVKMNKKFTDDPTASYRHTCIETNGDLHSSITWTADEADTEVLFNLFNQPGVDSAVVTFELDCITREITVAIPHCLWTTNARRKGWDGCIYGNRPPRSSATGRLILTPVAPVTSPPITTLDLLSSSPSGQVFENPSVAAKGGGRKWSDGHVTLMKAYDDGTERGLDWTSFGNGGGVEVDLGHSASVNFKLTKFDSGDAMQPEELITRTLGPIRGLTNRPPPPFLDTMLLRSSSEGVECSVDFSPLSSPTVTVQIFLGGMMVAERTGVPAWLGQPVLILPEWPNGLGKVGGAVPCRRGTIRSGPIRLGGGGGAGGLGGFQPAGDGQPVLGDEFRILAEMPAGAPKPDYYSGFRFEGTDGADWRVTNPDRVLVCPPDALHVTRGSTGVILEWQGATYRIQGAENVTGPWFDLGPTSPVLLNVDHPARFFRLICD